MRVGASRHQAPYLIDVEAHCCGGADADVQDKWVALGLQVQAKLLAQLEPWLLHTDTWTQILLYTSHTQEWLIPV